MSKFYQGKLSPDQGEIREKSGNLIFKNLWPPCLFKEGQAPRGIWHHSLEDFFHYKYNVYGDLFSNAKGQLIPNSVFCSSQGWFSPFKVHGLVHSRSV